jgi:putative thioredoxin
MTMTLSGNGKAPAAAASAYVKDSSTQAFLADVIEASRKTPVLVDFWAPWCGPCKQLTPALEKAVNAAKGAVRLVKINIDENQQLAAQMRIQSIPAVFAFVDGQPVDGFMGALPESEINKFIAKLGAAAGAGGTEELLAAAAAALEAGDAATAIRLYGQVLETDRENLKVLAGLARAQLAAGDLDKAKAVLALVPPAKANDAQIVSARAAIELAGKAADPDTIADLAAAVDKDKGDHQARLDLAVALNGAGRREEALDHLLSIVRSKRDWNEDAARKQLVQFFDAWGPKDELTIAGRRRLSSILFS